MRTLPLLFLAALLSCAEAPPDFTADLLNVASEYARYGRVDETLAWAPAACDRPTSTGRISESTPSSPHGRKLYALFVRRPEPYLAGKTQPVGQVLVKEAWRPEPAPDYTLLRQTPERDGWRPFAERDGKVWRAAEKTDLFVMLKLSADRPGTDQGWVYGTVSADGRTVTSAGKLGSCMDCHVQASPDRLFGIPR